MGHRGPVANPPTRLPPVRQDGAMTLPVPDRSATLAAMDTSVRAYTGLLRSDLDPSATAIGEWSVRGVAVHTAHIASSLRSLASGGKSPITDHRDMSTQWMAMVRTDDTDDLAAIAEQISADAGELSGLLSQEMWAEPVDWHGGLRARGYSLATIQISESRLHGLDIARTGSIPWEIPRSDAIFSIEGLLPVLHNFVNQEAAAGLDAVFELRVRGGSTLYFSFEDGTLVVDTLRPNRVDCVVSADPLSYLLIGYGRIGQWGPIFSGKVVSWGRKPLLALRFGKLFVSP
jgi:hypothetical protein